MIDLEFGPLRTTEIHECLEKILPKDLIFLLFKYDFNFSFIVNEFHFEILSLTFYNKKVCFISYKTRGSVVLREVETKKEIFYHKYLFPLGWIRKGSKEFYKTSIFDLYDDFYDEYQDEWIINTVPISRPVGGEENILKRNNILYTIHENKYLYFKPFTEKKWETIQLPQKTTNWYTWSVFLDDIFVMITRDENSEEFLNLTLYNINSQFEVIFTLKLLTTRVDSFSMLTAHNEIYVACSVCKKTLYYKITFGHVM